MTMHRQPILFMTVLMLVAVAGCKKPAPPIARPTPPPVATTNPDANKPPAPPTPVSEPRPVPPEPVAEDPISGRDIGDINKNSPFQPVFFALDSSEVDSKAQQALNANAEIMKKYPTWVISVEGHADERGTAEYNLALGISGDRLRTVSYGKEFPFDPGHDEAAWAKNRRAQFVLTSK